MRVSGGTNVATFGSSNLRKYSYGFEPVTTPTSHPSISLTVASNCTTAPHVGNQNGELAVVVVLVAPATLVALVVQKDPIILTRLAPRMSLAGYAPNNWHTTEVQ